ncbi:MAG: hypothetical protein FWC55_09235 [Firmicutes bacterium]|nr:hypothetical protein [Bacillota bacterium]
MNSSGKKTGFPPVLGAAALVLALALLPAASLSAAPGDLSDDPLARVSYVDDKVSGLDEKVNQLLLTVQALQNGGAAGQTPGGAGAGAAYVPVGASAGRIILGGEGAEIILRSGSASAVCPGENGLSDVTDGVDITNGVKIPANHLLIIPRYDGRGVAVTADAWFLIKGGYTVN